MIRSMISKTIRSTITTLINPFYGLLSRYFVTLDSVLNSHYEIATPVTLAGDFEIEVEFSTTSTVIQIITGDTSNDFISLISSGTKVRFKIGGVEADSNNLTLIDGKLHKIKVVRVGSVITTFVDGIASATLTNAGVSTFGYIGTWDAASLYFDGIIANAKFTDKSGASDVVTTFKLDQATANTESSVEGSNSVTYVNIPQSARKLYTLKDDIWTGSEELITNGNFDTDLSGWSIFGGGWTWDNGTARLDGNGSLQHLQQYNVFDTSKTYEISVVVSNLSGNLVGIFSDKGNTHLTNGVNTHRFNPITTNLGFKRETGVTTANIDSITVTEIIEVAP